jgi:hypothetical protein
MEQHWRLARKDPEYRWRRVHLEQEIKKWIENYLGEGLPIPIVRIPVVVHIIYNTPEQYISDDQVHSQINVLNADFRRMNSDARFTPSPFVPVAADARIEFALAIRDPSCSPTTGITRTYTPVPRWRWGEDGMKSSATGGHDPWDVDKYLNIWVVNYFNGIGSSSFPEQAPALDGVVCHFKAFGTTGDLISRVALGRTATHEIGHYLNLLHIWGNDDFACSGDDEVADTPNQAGPSPEDPTPPCRTFPSISCSNGPDGDMFMNFMDYSPDQCMNLFTYGQVSRMHATLNISRSSLLASDGLVPVISGSRPDLWMKDTIDDTGDEPNTSLQPMHISDDIWVRKIDDGIFNHDHQNPVYRGQGAGSNYVYVRVRNRSCNGIQSGIVKLYWAKASPSLSWPSPWDGSVTYPVTMGGIIGSRPVSVAARDYEIVKFPWMPPNPNDYLSIGADESHFCLLARIETSPTSPYGMTYPENSNLYANVKKNNNIVMKNITVIDRTLVGLPSANIVLSNFSKKTQMATLIFQTPKQEKASIFDWADVIVEPPINLVKKDSYDTNDNSGVLLTGKGMIQLLRSDAFLGSFQLDPNKIHVLNIRFIPKQIDHLDVRVLTLDILQKEQNLILGGQRLIIKYPPADKFVQNYQPKLIFDGVSWKEPTEKPSDR